MILKENNVENESEPVYNLELNVHYTLYSETFSFNSNLNMINVKYIHKLR